MDSLQITYPQKSRLSNLVKVGLLKELYRRHHITRAQFERLMQLRRA